jgi:hypothetical protein
VILPPDQAPPPSPWAEPYLRVTLHRDDEPRVEISDRLGNVLLTAHGPTPKAALRRMTALIKGLMADRAAPPSEGP